MEVSLYGIVYELSEGMSVSICINLTGDLERDVEVTLTTSSSSSSRSASGKILRT